MLYDEKDLYEAREYFENDRYATEATGIVIEAIGKNYAKCSIKIEEKHKNALGAVMGGVFFTLADFVFAISSNFRTTPTVTCVSQITYLSPIQGEMLYGESKLLKDGKRNCFYEIKIKDELENLVAIVMTTGTHVIF